MLCMCCACHYNMYLGNVERIDKASSVKKYREIVVESHRGRGKPQKTLDRIKWKFVMR